MMSVELEPRYRDEVRRIIARIAPNAQAYIFGSRISARGKRFSDLDIALEAQDADGLPIKVLSKLRDAFSMSNLPMKVEIVDWHALDPAFRESVAPRREPL